MLARKSAKDAYRPMEMADEWFSHSGARQKIEGGDDGSARRDRRSFKWWSPRQWVANAGGASDGVHGCGGGYTIRREKILIYYTRDFPN
jgi:hypothetical protein